MDTLVEDITNRNQELFGELVHVILPTYGIKTASLPYSFIINNDSLGWNHDILINFKVVKKAIQPSAHVLTSAPLTSSSLSPSSRTTSEVYIPFVNTQGPSNTNTSKSLVHYLDHADPHVFASGIVYKSDLPYFELHSVLSKIGHELLGNVDASSSSPSLPSSMIHPIYYNVHHKISLLEQALSNLAAYGNDTALFDEFIQSITILNSLSKLKTGILLELLAILSYESWTNMSLEKRNYYTTSLSLPFIERLMSNQFINMMLSLNKPELVIKVAYLFSMFKILFVIMGYSMLTPYFSDLIQRYNPFYRQDHPLNMPVNYKYVYEHLVSFMHTYKLLTDIIGPIETLEFKPVMLISSELPSNYYGLTDLDNGMLLLPQFLWRFNDIAWHNYLFNRYIKYYMNQNFHDIKVQNIESKIRYLHEI